MDTKKAFSRFLETIKTLRAPGGCPWDRDQTPLSMRRDLIEETFEAVDAISAEDSAHAKEELGDVMLNAFMIAYMYEQKGDFTVADVLTELTDKLIRRHPHVFPQSEGKVCMKSEVNSSDAVLNQWDRIKENVEGRKTQNTILDEIPASFPPLLKAYKMQKKAGKRGFDWTDIKPVKSKVLEELEEVEQAYEELRTAEKASPTQPDGKIPAPFTENAPEAVNKAQLHIEEEIGDLLFAAVNYARHLGVDPETALSRTNQKFYRRFSYVEQHMKQDGIPMDNEHLKEEDGFWNQAKKQGL